MDLLQIGRAAGKSFRLNLLLWEGCLNVVVRSARGSGSAHSLIRITVLNQQAENQGLMGAVLTLVFRRGHPA